MRKITATLPVGVPPSWAILERALFDLMDRSVYPFWDRYTRDDGRLIWKDTWDQGRRDGADDFYESFYNWPLYYLLGGGDHLLPLAQKAWDGITAQLTDLGVLYKEYERGYDQFHQSENYIFFYFLCLADPTHVRNIQRAKRFAGFYLNEDPDAPNYDPDRKLIRAPHNGSAGPRWGFTDGEPVYGWSEGMRRYGLPYADVPGIQRYDDLKDPHLARRMGQVMQERMGKGDVAGNLLVTSLLANACLLTGEEKYRRWIIEYVDAWIERAERNGGLLPDNIGLSGEIGEYLDGKWYGGLYGWTWPHGFYNIEMAAIVSGANAFLLTGDPRYLDLPRFQLDAMMALGERRDVATLEMSLAQHWIGEMNEVKAGQAIFVVPYRYGDAGWFDYQPLSAVFPTAIWNISMATADWGRIERLRKAEAYDWRAVVPFRNKEDCGHEQPWLRFLAGDNPTYPEDILRATYSQVCRRLALIRTDEADLTQVNIHHWQQHNPVITEALIQLTLGAPQIIYNGGLLHSRLRYFDADRQRPGLPADVAALVSGLKPQQTVVHLVNLSPFATRNVLIQAGAFGEHRFNTARYPVRLSDYPGSPQDYAEPPVESREAITEVNHKWLPVTLPPATQIVLDLEMDRYVNRPAYTLPW